MIFQQALEHGAQIGRRFEIAVLIQIGGLKSGPVRDHASALESPADEKRHGRRAMVGAVGAVGMEPALQLLFRGRSQEKSSAIELSRAAIDYFIMAKLTS